MRPVAIAILLSAFASPAQVAVGIKGGVPLTDVLEARGFIGGMPFVAKTHRFTVGPVLEIGLPLGFGVEFDALYKQYDQSGGSIVFGQTVNKTGNSWEFPLLGKYRFPAPFVHPYAEGGVSFHRLSDFLLPFRGTVGTQPTGTETRTGLALGGGLELKLLRVRVSAGIRYSHWGEGLLVPRTNLADFLVGITF